MAIAGCPECGRTPVIYLLSSKIWTCKSCRHSWREEDGKTEPVYFIADISEQKRKELLKKPATKKSAPKKAIAKKAKSAISSVKKGQKGADNSKLHPKPSR